MFINIYLTKSKNPHQIFPILICCYFHFSVWIKGHPFLIEPLAWHKSAATNPAVWNNSKNTAKPSQKQKNLVKSRKSPKLTNQKNIKKKPIQDSFNYRIASWCEDKIVWIHKNSAPPPSTNHFRNLDRSLGLSVVFLIYFRTLSQKRTNVRPHPRARLKKLQNTPCIVHSRKSSCNEMWLPHHKKWILLENYPKKLLTTFWRVFFDIIICILILKDVW